MSIYQTTFQKRHKCRFKKGNKRGTRQTVKRTERKGVGVRKNRRGKRKTKR